MRSDGHRPEARASPPRERSLQSATLWLKGIHMAIEWCEEMRIHVELTVLESQREKLQLAWHEIVAGRPHAWTH